MRAFFGGVLVTWVIFALLWPEWTARESRAFINKLQAGWSQDVEAGK